MPRHIILFLIVFFSVIISHAQNFGGNPGSIRWRQINTDTARVIYPAGLDSVAARVATIIHVLQSNYVSTIGDKKRKVSIVLQDNTLLSNGYVALGPFRSEFFISPEQNSSDLGAQAWADNLALHEFRHVQQYANFNIGLSKVAGIILGQYGQDFANAASVPDWFFEGDAVYNETMLSKQGRGRLPSFFNGYKSFFFEKKTYSYMKLRNGSLKNYVPNHYNLGYLLVAYGRDKYGMDFWRNVTTHAAQIHSLYPLQKSVEKYAGIEYKQFVHDAFSFYQQQWQQDSVANAEWLTATQKNNVVNYKYPYNDNGDLIVLKNSNSKIPTFYRITKTGEEKIATRDISYDDYFSYSNGRIIYTAYAADVRWGNRNYSNIKLLNLADGSTQTITHHGKYFSPDIAHNGSLIAATTYTDGKTSALVLMDSSGKIIRTRSNKAGHVFSYPKFSDTDTYLYYFDRNEKGESAIWKESVSEGNAELILPYANRMVNFPVVQGDTLIYTCTNDGKDELWAYQAKENKHYKLASYRTGAYQGVLKGDKVISSVFTSDGYRLAALPIQWDPIAASDTLKALYVQKPFGIAANNTLQQVQPRQFETGKYSKANGLFNFHSWLPYYSSPEYSVTIYGQNVLNTYQSQLYYIYNENEQSNRVGYTGAYGGWFVEPVFNVSQTWHRSGRYNRDTVFHWNESNFAAGLQLPLNFSSGKYYRFLTLSSLYNYQDVQWTGLAKNLLRKYNLNYLDTRIQFTSQVQQAAKHIYPHWGQTISLQYKNTIDKYTARQFLARAAIYLPGLAASHSLVLTGAYQARDTANQYYFDNDFPFARGYTSADFPRMWRISGNYHFPLLYPDWGFANIVYFQRVRANAFYDYSIGKSLKTGNTTPFNTVGGEIYFDTKWWNQQPVTFGVRYSHLLNNNVFGSARHDVWEFIMPVSLFR